MKLVAAAQGRFGTLLSRILRDAATSRAQESEIEDWIRNQTTSLPDTYRRVEIFPLAHGCRSGRIGTEGENFSLSLDTDPIAKLDASDPGWRDAFHLPVEDRWFRSGPLPESHLTQSNWAFSFSVYRHTP